jgi:hypothetical protein
MSPSATVSDIRSAFFAAADFPCKYVSYAYIGHHFKCYRLRELCIKLVPFLASTASDGVELRRIRRREVESWVWRIRFDACEPLHISSSLYLYTNGLL